MKDAITARINRFNHEGTDLVSIVSGTQAPEDVKNYLESAKDVGKS